MDYEISESTLSQTTKCHCEFACLKKGGTPKCDVEDLIPNDGCFIKRAKSTKCEYLLSYGYSWICTCPTRSELYQRYQK